MSIDSPGPCVRRRPLRLVALALLLASSAPLAATQKSTAPVTSWTIEMEGLVARAQATGVAPGVQGMAGFGAGWGGDAQLFWGAERDGAFLRLSLSAPRSGRFEVALVVTTAPDFARFEVSLDGAPPVAIDGYAPVVGRRRVELGEHELAPGEHELLVRIAGRNPASSGWRVGLDRLELTLRPAPTAPAPSGTGGPKVAATPRTLTTSSGTRAAARPLPAAALAAGALPAGARLRALRLGTSTCSDPSLCYEPGTLVFVPPGASSTRVRFEWDVTRVPRAARVAWQVSGRPFPAGSALLPANEVVAQGTGAGPRGGFEVDASAALSESGSEIPTLYVRALPLLDGAEPRAAGRPTETIRVLRADRATAPVEIVVESHMAPKLVVARFEWVPLVEYPRWPPGCKDDPDDDEGLFEKIVGAVGDVWNWAVEAYADAKGAVVDVVAFIVPVVPRSELEFAFNAALVAAGIPPDIPNLDRLLSDGADVLANELAAQIPIPEGVTGLAVEALREQVRQESREALLDAAEELRRQAIAAHGERCTRWSDNPYLRVSIRNDGPETVDSWTVRLLDDALPRLYRTFELPVTHLAPGETRVYPVPLTDPRSWNVIAGPRSQMPDWDRGRDLDDWWKRSTTTSHRFQITTATRIDCLPGGSDCRDASTTTLFESPQRSWWREARQPWSWTP